MQDAAEVLVPEQIKLHDNSRLIFLHGLDE